MSSISNLIATGPAYVPLRLSGRPIVLKAVVVALGVAFLTASSLVQVPMWPVPMTMQTFAVLMVGALCGWRLSALTVIVWLALAMLNIPVLSEGKAGYAVFVGTTGGYLAAFPIMSLFIGWMAERGWTSRPIPAFITLLIAEAICFTMGVAWLSTIIGFSSAVWYGFALFAFGDLVKTLLAVAVIEVARRSGRPK
jgi:biotin transport system substrate-specific component